jgi:hypothetical protein
MAKASTGRAKPAKAKAAPPAAVRKKAKAPVAAPKKKIVAKAKTAAKKVPVVKVEVRKSRTARMTAAASAKATPAKKAAASKKVAPVKKAVARRPVARTAVPTPAARRARAVAVPRKAAVAPPPRAAKVNPPQVFTVSHLNQADFKADGLRTYAQYRDLGIAAATGGLCQAHVIRFTPPCTDEVRKRHVHTVDLQLVYVLQGWMKNEFEGQGEQMMSAGSCWIQPTGIRHTVLDYSADCEVLEIIVPADFKTDELT